MVLELKVPHGADFRALLLQMVLWIDQDETKSMPAIGFEHAVIDFLNAVGGTIDIDTYRN